MSWFVSVVVSNVYGTSAGLALESSDSVPATLPVPTDVPLKEGTDWRTVLLTPLREGGESLLALDVTDPTATAGYHGPYPRLMWEFTHSRLGQTWSKPIFTKLKIRAGLGVGDRCGIDNGDGDCVKEWVAIFGAGYYPQSDPNLSTYTNDPNSGSYTTKGRGVFIVRVKDGTILGQLAQDPNSAEVEGGRAKLRHWD